MKADAVKNFVCISGVITEKFTHSHNNYYISNLKVKRNSGKFDNFPIMCEWKDGLENIEVGTVVSIHGEIRHYGKMEKETKQIVLIRTIEVLDKETYENFAYVVGTVNTNYLFGEKREATIEVERVYNVTDFVTLYTFNERIEKRLRFYNPGEKICALGRLKTRYFKRYMEEEKNKIIEIEIQLIL